MFKKLITEIKNSTDSPIMISTDQEGGKVQRLNSTNVGFKDRPPMYEIGQTLDEELAFRIGKAMGEESLCRKSGDYCENFAVYTEDEKGNSTCTSFEIVNKNVNDSESFTVKNNNIVK